MLADSVYQYGIHAILDASLIGAPQRERVSRRTRSKARREIAVTHAVSHWGDPVDDTHPATPNAIYPRLSGRPGAQTRHLITIEEPN
jgi:hypothetical protein